MARAITLKAGQLLLLMFAVFMIGMGAGAGAAGLYWHVHGFVVLAAPLGIVGLVAFLVLSIWKSTDDWAARTGYRPPS